MSSALVLHLLCRLVSLFSRDQIPTKRKVRVYVIGWDWMETVRIEYDGMGLDRTGRDGNGRDGTGRIG